MASTLKQPNTAEWRSGSSAGRPQSSASQLTAGLKTAGARGIFNTAAPRTPSSRASTMGSLGDARPQVFSSTWPTRPSNQSKEKNISNQPTSTSNAVDLIQASGGDYVAIDDEICRSNDHHETLRASALWERYKTANTAPYRQTFSRSHQDDEFWKQVSNSYSVW